MVLRKLVESLSKIMTWLMPRCEPANQDVVCLDHPETHDYTYSCWGHDIPIQHEESPGGPMSVMGIGRGVGNEDVILLDTTSGKIRKYRVTEYLHKVGTEDLWGARLIPAGHLGDNETARIRRKQGFVNELMRINRHSPESRQRSEDEEEQQLNIVEYFKSITKCKDCLKANPSPKQSNQFKTLACTAKPLEERGVYNDHRCDSGVWMFAVPPYSDPQPGRTPISITLESWADCPSLRVFNVLPREQWPEWEE